MVALWVTFFCKHEISLCIIRTSSSLIFVSSVSVMRTLQLSASVLQMLVNSTCQVNVNQCQRLNIRDSVSETQCQRPNVRDKMSLTKCQRPNVRDSMSESECQVRFTKLGMHVGYTAHLGIHFDTGIPNVSVFVMFSFPSLICCKAFSECRLATYSIYGEGNLV